MSISNSYPTQNPVLNLNFATGSDQFLDSRISYSRSSTGTYLSNEKHLSSENLLLQSQDFDTTWAKSSLNAPTGSQTAPDGTSTAWLLTTAASGTGSPFLFQNPSGAVANNAVCTYVMHIKAGTASHAYISFRGQSSSSAAWALIDFAAPTSPTTGGSLGSISATSVALGSSWYRVALTFNTGTVSSGYPYVYVGASDGTAPDSTGRVTWTYSGETLYAWGAQLSSTNSKVYDSPTTTQISREFAPLLKTAAANAPRFEYAADGQSVGLLIESSATNLQRYGSAFASWDEIRYTTVTSNSGIAPNGLREADLVVPNSTAIFHYIFDTTAVIANATTYTGSVYVKKAGHRYIQMTASTANFGSNQWATFDLDDGSIDANNVTASAESVGNGWWRIQATMTSISAGTGGLAITFANTATGPIYPTISGNDFAGVLLWGWQLETGSSASSLVDTGTGGSTATRAADSCAVVDATLFSSGEHTIIWEGDTDYAPNDKRFFALSDGSMNNRFVADHDNGTATRLRNWADGVKNVDKSTGVVDMLVGSHKLAATVKTNESQLVVDGTRRQVDTDCVVGSGIDQLAINSSTTGAGPTYNMNGHCKRITYFNVALSQAEAEALTSNP